jgi:hypothetical protein
VNIDVQKEETEFDIKENSFYFVHSENGNVEAYTNSALSPKGLEVLKGFRESVPKI